ncbi:MAG: hypothetical protein K2H74_03745 [Paramuribaculum sp.]|nr:hypothetical protein [Paramuribaculum sp.]
METIENTEITENTENTEVTQPAETAPSTEELIAEAERRGYVRGRNEALAESLRRPAMMAEPGVGETEATAPATESQPLTDDLSSAFLSRIRPSVWNL